MKVLVAYSGGKDSQAALIWASKEYGIENIEAVFCDTGWEHDLTYKHIIDTTSQLKVKLVVLKSKTYNGFIDMVIKKLRFPSTKARFCTEELKSKPMIDYVLEHKENLIIIQGIRKSESISRSKMNEQCHLFKYYFVPYGYDKNNKPKYHTYRKKDVKEFINNYSEDIIRPHFNESPQYVLNYILENNQKPNPLYYKGMHRVGCFPCVMCSLAELQAIIKYFPEDVERIINTENEVNEINNSRVTFFSANKIPEYAKSIIDNKSGKKIARFIDVVNYIKNKNQSGNMFEETGEDQNHSCMSFYGICE